VGIYPEKNARIRLGKSTLEDPWLRSFLLKEVRRSYQDSIASSLSACLWESTRIRVGLSQGLSSQACPILNRVAQNARGVVKGVVQGVARSSFGRGAPQTPQLKRASARRREVIVFRGVYMTQQVAAVHLD